MDLCDLTFQTKIKAKDTNTHFSWESDMDLHFRLGRILIRSLSFWSVGFLTDPEQTPGTKIHCRYKNSKIFSSENANAMIF